MALTYDLTAIPNHEERCYEQRDDGLYLNPVTEHLIWASLNTGIGSITTKNYHEVWRRLRMWSHVLDGRKPYVTAEDVRNHIGLSTNASRKTKHQFHSHVIRLVDRELDAKERKAS